MPVKTDAVAAAPGVAVSAARLSEKEIVVTGTVLGVRDGIAVVDTRAEQDGNGIIRNAEAELRPAG